MSEKIRFMFSRMREKLWLKPLIICLFSVIAALLAHMADDVVSEKHVSHLLPKITLDSIEDLLKITAASMLVIATFAVASMVSAYASAGSTATPRALSVVIGDDVSQNALSTFIGVFIFSVVALVALKNGYYEKAGLLVLFILTLTALAIVIVTFLRWVDRIARLGRMGTVIDKVESATFDSLMRRRRQPTMQGAPMNSDATNGTPVYAKEIGYVQQIDIGKLQTLAEHQKIRVTVAALPGTFISPERPVALITGDRNIALESFDHTQVTKAFTIGQDRLFDSDPRFGIIVLSEIASRALSPAVNDPGSAIDVIGTLVRLFLQYSESYADDTKATPTNFYDRVHVPELSIKDMFDDAFTAISRDGAGFIEVQLRLQKALYSIAAGGDEETKAAALYHARRALGQAEKALHIPEDISAVKSAGLLR